MNKANAECGVRSAESPLTPSLSPKGRGGRRLPLPDGERIEVRGRRPIYGQHSELRTPNSKGFTLIEVLLALAILAAVMTVVYASFSTTSRNVESAEAIRDDTDLARTLIARLSDDIANAYYNQEMKTITILYGKKEEAGTGNDKRRLDSISMTTLTNWRKPDSKEMDLWEVGYHFEETADGKGHVLMRREKRELSKDVPLLEGGVDYEITDKVEGFQLRYFNGSQWSDEWDTRSHPGLPRAAELSLIFANGKQYITVVDVRNGQLN